MTHNPSVSIRRTLCKLLPPELIQSVAATSGAFCRIRKIEPVPFVWCLILGSMIGRVRQISTLRRVFESVTGVLVEESSYYARFTPALATMLQGLLEHALQHSWGRGRSSKGALARFVDIMVTDATVIRLHKLLAKTFPGTRTNQSGAGLKAHAVLCVTGSGKQTIKLTPERTSDGSKLIVNSWVAGKLLLMDLGYYDHRLLNRIHVYKGFFITRIKSCAMPLILEGNTESCTKRMLGRKVWDVVKQLKGEVLDVNASFRVRVRKYAGHGHTIVKPYRVVAVFNENSGDYQFYATNIPTTDLSGQEIARTYSLRWEVETIFKELKTHFRLAQVDTTKPAIVESLVYASLLALTASRCLLRSSLRCTRAMDERFVPTGRWATIISSIAMELAQCVLASRAQPALEKRLLATLHHEAPDPNKRLRLVEQIEAQMPHGPRRVHPGPGRRRRARAA